MREVLLNSVFFGVFLCLAAFQISLMLKKRFKFAILNPLLISNLLVIGVLLVFDIPYENFNNGAKYISFFLTPLTICLAVPLYEQLNLLKNNLKAIFAGLIGGVIGGLVCIYILALIFGLNHEFFVTLLPKSVTAPIGMGVSEKLGGVVTITVASIIITGIFGNMCGAFFLKIFRVKNSVAKGLALGAASHAMGVARAIEMGSIEGAMASLALAVTGLLTVVGASIFAMFL